MKVRLVYSRHLFRGTENVVLFMHWMRISTRKHRHATMHERPPLAWVVLKIHLTMRGTIARCISYGFKRVKAGVLDIETRRKMDPRL